MELLGLDVPIWLVLVVGILCIYYKYLTANFGVFSNCAGGMRGPRPWPVVGTCVRLFTKGPLEYDRELINKYGKLVTTWFGRSPHLIVADADILREILIKQFHNFTNRIKIIHMEPPLDCMLTLLHDDQWRHVRNLVSPTFTASKLRRLNEPMNECAEVLVKNLVDMSKTGDPVDVQAPVGAFTMDVIARTAFGLDIDSQSDPDNPFVKMAMKAMRAGLAAPAALVILFFPFLAPYMGKLGISFIPVDTVRFFVKTVKKAMQMRTESDQSSRTDFLQLMMDAHKHDDENEEPTEGEQSINTSRKGLTENELLAQGFVFFLGGFDTVANAITFTLYLLALNPDIQDKLVVDISTLLEDKAKPTYDSVQKIPYLDMVVSESMRLYPATARVERLTTDDITVNGVFIPKKVQIVIPIDYLHHDPHVYPDPYKFDPERFTDEAKADRDPIYYQPFGLGPRHCVAMRLGLMEVKMAIVTILQHFTVATCPETDIPIKRNKMTGRPEGLKLNFTTRD